jgi:hypothetical protein
MTRIPATACIAGACAKLRALLAIQSLGNRSLYFYPALAGFCGPIPRRRRGAGLEELLTRGSNRYSVIFAGLACMPALSIRRFD